MDQIIIGLFLGFLARVIKNPAHAAMFSAELDHIRSGIEAVLTQQATTTPVAGNEQK